ncbi:MAG TPA: alpha/beta fold hydrolase [Gaiellaceae bacterium]|nr:alpha/beta fold hydrolase [Gaiellaceae bacterium]
MIRAFLAATAVIAATVAAWLALASTAGAALAFSPCGGSTTVQCGKVTVPLDWSGAVPGTLSLAVQELPAAGTPRGVMVMVAGGPGQASALAWDLATLGPSWQKLFPGYTLVAFDPRGTGGSGFLNCVVGASGLSEAQQVATCGQELGPERAYYTTAANAEDIDAVRAALGAHTVAVWGVSYGTKVALAYAAAFPTHVERLLLDSVVTPTGPDPLALDSLQGIPLGLGQICGDAACHAITPDLAGELATLANRAEITPIRGRVRTPSGRLANVAMDGLTLVEVAIQADLDPGLRSELPSAIQAASTGRPGQLLRIAVFGESGFALADNSFSEGLFLATTCNDGRFPWGPTDDLPTREQELASAVAALPAGATGPFGSWATQIGPASICLDWPAPAGNAAFPAGPFPDVPVLALSGSFDMRTPTANAASIVAQFPHGHLLVVPGIGHSVLTTDPSSCTANAVRAWLNGLAVADRCPRVRPYLAAVPRIPVSLAAARPAKGTTGLRGRTLSVVEATVQDAFASEVTAGTAIAGLTSGSATGELGILILRNFGDVPGVAVTGFLDVKTAKSGPVVVLTGSVKVTGTRAAHGTVTYTPKGVKAVWAKTHG